MGQQNSINQIEADENKDDSEIDENVEAKRGLIKEELIQCTELTKLIEIANLSKLKLAGNSSRKRKRKISDGDETFRCSSFIPLERRKSGRLQNKHPDYNGSELPDEKLISRHSYGEYELKDLEKIIYKPKKRRLHIRSENDAPRPPIIQPEDVTEEMLNNIACTGKKKIYDVVNGTTCHQCRQKTRDTKTCCRNPNCVGTLGQFCGQCIFNRYGETVKEALKDPNWNCFVCRGTCNCSICRKKQGKIATGILAPEAFKKGYDSVHALLEDLNKSESVLENQNEDILNEDVSQAAVNNDSLIDNESGFEEENNRIKIKMSFRHKKNTESKKKKLPTDQGSEDNLEPIIGFSTDGNSAILTNGSMYCLIGKENVHENDDSLMPTLGFSDDGKYAMLKDGSTYCLSGKQTYEDNLEPVTGFSSEGKYAFLKDGRTYCLSGKQTYEDNLEPITGFSSEGKYAFLKDGSTYCLSGKQTYEDNLEPMMGFSSEGKYAFLKDGSKYCLHGIEKYDNLRFTSESK